MNLQSFRLKNFRRLKDVYIDLDSELSIFVGANNSGKTSATHGLKKFVQGDRHNFDFHDFSADCWTEFDQIGEMSTLADAYIPPCPKLSADLWFKVGANDLHRIVDLLPGLDWGANEVGVRIELHPSNIATTLSEYGEAKRKVTENVGEVPAGQAVPNHWPRSLSDYLKERVSKEFEMRYYVLDPNKFDDNGKEIDGYEPSRIISDKTGHGGSVIDRLMKVDLMDAQRYLSESSSGGRAEDLSRCLGRFYKRNLEQLGPDYVAMGALAGSQDQLNSHLGKVFDKTLKKLAGLGYPGVGNPKIEIRTTLDPTTILSSNNGARVYYALDGVDGAELSLPDQYNGLGFKNLIYMVVELLDLDARWRQIEENRPPLHIVIIEEPEAHMHAQLQQVFIREILKLLPSEVDRPNFFTQFLITTHSSHILYERGFRPIRYFRRENNQQTTVINLSAFYAQSEPKDRDFLERYLKITHCDLFFADAAILVEGNVERLLMPLFISKVREDLGQCFLTILEVGGAFGHKFISLIEYLGLTGLVITDIDSILPRAAAVAADATTISTADAVADTSAEADHANEEEEEDEDDDEDVTTAGADSPRRKSRACLVDTESAVTSNQTLIKWLPKKKLITELLAVLEAQKIQEPTDTSRACVRVCYQTRRPVTWQGATNNLVGRTLEESFALENLTWCQDPARKGLKLVVRGGRDMELPQISQKIFNKVVSPSFNKTSFALALMHEKKDDWEVPHYITEGLKWLGDKILPTPHPVVPLAAETEGGEALPSVVTGTEGTAE